MFATFPVSGLMYTAVFQSFVAEKPSKLSKRAVLSSVTNTLPRAVIVCRSGSVADSVIF